MTDDARVTQQYVEVAISEDSEAPFARVTQQYVEVILKYKAEISVSIKDSEENPISGVDGLFDDFVETEFNQGTLTDVETPSKGYGLKLKKTDDTYSLSGSKKSQPISIADKNPNNLKIRWKQNKPSNTNVNISIGVSDTTETEPETWYEQTNSTKLKNLPEDLTGKYLWYKVDLETENSAISPELEWLVIWDVAITNKAAIRVFFNNEIKKILSSGSVNFRPLFNQSLTAIIKFLSLGTIKYPDEIEQPIEVEEEDEEEIIIPEETPYFPIRIGSDLILKVYQGLEELNNLY
jgi:hypothetical protein